jgi:CBS domain-containing protein
MQITYAVRNFMTETIVTVASESPLLEAMRRMVDNEIGSVAVVRDGVIVGILTERDVLKNLVADPAAAGRSVGKTMSSPVVTIDGGAALGQVADLMAARKIRRLMVTEDDRIRGIVTERDVMRATLDVFNKLSDAWV